jgi:poly(beta-D-mannuronate) lyase
LHPGRVIIGQIHASDDEPARLYYHKLPGNTNGSIYLASEERNGRDDLINIIGSESRSQSNPARGIPLNEPFSYEIRTVGDRLFVTITKADGTEYSLGDDIDSARSSERNVSNDGSIRALGYNLSDEYMYFKVGAYTQNNTGNSNDYDQVTVYSIDNTHN